MPPERVPTCELATRARCEARPLAAETREGRVPTWETKLLHYPAPARHTMRDENATCRSHAGRRHPRLARGNGSRVSRYMPTPRIRRHDVPRLQRVHVERRISEWLGVPR